jgi:cation:H+ antiporter
MALDVTLLIGSLILILLTCAVFVNAIERFGDLMGFHQGIVGSILAAVGTALPETVIPILAILCSSSASSHEVGIGAIAGAPFMLATLGFFVTGAAVIVYSLMGKRKLKMSVSASIMGKDLLFFLIIYAIAIASTLFHDHTTIKVIVAAALLASYSIYMKLVFSSEVEMVENVETLYLKKYFGLKENLLWTTFQLALALVMIVLGAHWFIKYVQTVSAAAGVSPLILSLIITPIATELPEKLNSIIWVGKNKDTLALGNITGAMVFQSCVPVVFGMIFTHWDIHGITLASAILALLSGAVNLVWLRVFKTLNPFVLLSGGLFYLIFVALLIMGLR